MHQITRHDSLRCYCLSWSYQQQSSSTPIGPAALRPLSSVGLSGAQQQLVFACSFWPRPQELNHLNCRKWEAVAVVLVAVVAVGGGKWRLIVEGWAREQHPPRRRLNDLFEPPCFYSDTQFVCTTCIHVFSFLNHQSTSQFLLSVAHLLL